MESKTGKDECTLKLDPDQTSILNMQAWWMSKEAHTFDAFTSFKSSASSTHLVRINQVSRALSIRKLRQFSYFDAYFKRWQLKSPNQDEKSPDVIDVGNKMPFSLGELEELFEIMKTKHISPDFPVSRLESLIQCDEFFTARLVDDTMLRSHLSNTLEKLSDLKRATAAMTVVRLKKMVDAHIKEITAEIEHHREATWIPQIASFRGTCLTSVVTPDKKTVIDAFVKQLKLHWGDSIYKHFSFDGHSKCMLSLWNIIKKSRWLSDKQLRSALADVAQSLLDHCQPYQYITWNIEPNHFKCLVQFLNAMVKVDSQNRLVLMKACVVCTCMFKFDWSKQLSKLYNFTRLLGKTNAFRLVQFVIEYQSLFKWRNQGAGSKPNFSEWHKLIQYLVMSSDPVDLVSGKNFIKENFSTLVCCDKKVDWIVQLVEGKIGMQARTEIALEMVDHAVLASDTDNFWCQKSVRFINDSLDLDWSLVENK